MMNADRVLGVLAILACLVGVVHGLMTGNITAAIWAFIAAMWAGMALIRLYD